MNKKKIILLVCILSLVSLLAIASSYAIFRFNVTKNTNFKLVIGTLELSITDTETEDKYILESTVPTKDEVALEGEGYTFTITNTGTIDSYYTVYLDDILLTDAGDRLDNNYIKVNLLNNQTNVSTTKRLSDYEDTDRVLATGYLETKESVTYTLRMWVDYEAGNEAQNKYFATQIRVVGQQQNAVVYKEDILNGADPVLTDNLVPVMIADDGTVTRASTSDEWYDYETKNWANAVVLKNSDTYKVGEIIPEEAIESYFVWIPKYSYQLWDLGDYSSLTSVDNTKPHAIPIRFGLTNTSDSNTGECTTPGVAGESGNCSIGDYMTHPAFLAFDSNGIWVGKFETGYDGATSITAAQINNYDTSKIVIKPNVYSWRNITVGNMFENCYQYLRSDESHMMKNTEWGAVAYLSHSLYGTCEEVNDEIKCSEVRINNNSAYITGYAGTEEPTVGYNSGTSTQGNRVESTALATDGTYTVNYSNNTSNIASTTGNYTGVYDMSGGAWEYVMGYTTGASTVGGSSGITSLHSDFYENSNWNKYYDKYSLTVATNYNNRILGDATGEVGPFVYGEDPDGLSRAKSSWYNDQATFSYSVYPWSLRGGFLSLGSSSGIFSFSNGAGAISINYSFRIVLTPTK